MKLTVRVVPNASRDEIVERGPLGWKVRLAAPPVDGAANERLVRFLAETFDVPKSAIRIVSGHTGRTKTVDVDMPAFGHGL
jgi:uncharacterized protein (TIGR00251 family)